MTSQPVDIKKVVRERYAALARDTLDKAPGKGCCGPTPKGAPHATAYYSEELLQSLPDSVVEAARGCGNPVALAGLKPGEVVLDLGCGGGIDCFLAAQQVGPQGRVIGLDMTPEMIELARANAGKLGADNVEFRLGEMEAMPVASDSVDVIISNCVINLSPDKAAVFREAYRVLKPGGRLSVSDIVKRAPLPPEVEADLDAWSRCIAGASLKEEYLTTIREAGFTGVEVVQETDVSNPQGWRRNLASIKVQAVKPA